MINMRVATRQRRGFTYKDVAAINPRIIYASVSGYGEEGPDADLPDTDVIIQARAAGLPANYLCSVGGGAAQWDQLCRSVGLDHVIEAPRFDTAEKREQQVEVLYEILSRHLSARPAAEWEAILKAHSVNATVVQELSEVYDDPQVIANQMLTQFEQPGLGTVKAINVPFKMSSTADEPWFQRHAPALGASARRRLRRSERQE